MGVLLKVLSLLLAAACSQAFGAALTRIVTSRLPLPVSNLAAVYDGDDSIFIIGGYNYYANKYDQVFKYSLDSGRVEPIGTFLNINGGAAVMHGEDILYFGGDVDNQDSTDNVYRISPMPMSSTFTVAGKLPFTLSGMRVAWNPVAEVAYLFGGYSRSEGRYIDEVLRYNATSNEVEVVARLQKPTFSVAATWDSGRGVAYLFGGRSAGGYSRDVLQFDPATNAFTRAVTLPSALDSPTAVFADPHNKSYVIDWNLDKLIEFDVATQEAYTVDVDGWKPLGASASVYVPKLDRIYILGGQGSYSVGSSPTDDISYLQLGAQPNDCSDGNARLISDPTCCGNYYICLGGVATRQQCPDGQHFNPTTASCEEAAQVQCRVTFGQ